jgi:MarR family 2-MHQ and catechol resistance regulon transcriptional repressor
MHVERHAPCNEDAKVRQAAAVRGYVKLFRASESITARLSSFVASSAELTMTQFNVLETLYNLGPMRQRDLSGKVMRSAGNITMVLRNLEKARLVKRNKKKIGPKREYTVSLTNRGQALIAEFFPLFAKAVAEEMSVLNDHELETLGKLCRQVGLKQAYRDSGEQ